MPLEPATDLNVGRMALGAASGLVIFFLGMFEMTAGMRAAAKERLQRVLERFTMNRFSAVLTGTLTTGFVGSSSIVTIMTVGLVSTGLLAFSNALGVVMGANIGTTLSSQIIAFGLTDVFPIVLILGAILRLTKGEARKAWGRALMGLGLVFLGLEHLEAAMAPLRSSTWFHDAIRAFESPLYGIALGAGITAVVQSSSATMGVVIVLAGQGAVPLAAGIYIMMGAELGTCVDTLASTIGQSREALRTGVFHLLFNVINVALFAGFGAVLANFAQWLTPGTSADAIARQIANAHVTFNVVGVLLALPFMQHLSQLMYKLVPPKVGGATPRAL